MEEELHRRIVSQDGAISAVARAIRRTRAGLKNPNRPVGSFLFLGPTGVGKTEVARGLAAFLFGSERSLDPLRHVRVHGEALGLASSSARPPGYVGHEEGGQLTERVKRNPYCVVLLDEIEKAHPDIFNVLLAGVRGRPPHRRHRQPRGLQERHRDHDLEHRRPLHREEGADGLRVGRGHARRPTTTTDMVMGEVKRTFNPEFINRIDEIIIFDALTDAGPRPDHAPSGRAAEPTTSGRRASISIRDDGIEWLLAKTLAGPLLRRAAAAARHPAAHRGRALGGVHPRARSPSGLAIEVGVQEGALWYWQDEHGRGAVRMKLIRSHRLALRVSLAWFLGASSPEPLARPGAQSQVEPRRRPGGGQRWTSAGTSSCRRRRCSTTSRPRRATAYDEASSRTTSGGCGTRASSRT